MTATLITPVVAHISTPTVTTAKGGMLAATHRGAVRLLIVVLLGFLCSMGISGQNDSAAAWPCPGKAEAITPYQGGGIKESLFGNHPDPMGTAQEVYGVGGMTWSRYMPQDDHDDNPDADSCWGGLLDAVQNSTATLIFQFALFESSITTGTYEWAADPSLFDEVMEPLDKIVGTLRTTLYLNYLTPIIVCAALWMAWTGLVKKRTTEVTQGMGWMFAAATFAIIFMTYPTVIAENTNAFVTNLSTTIMKGTADAAGVGADKLCDASKSPSKKGELDESVREASCSIWIATAYTPWASGQFGAPPTKKWKIQSDAMTFHGAPMKNIFMNHLDAATLIDEGATESPEDTQKRWMAVHDSLKSGKAGSGAKAHVLDWDGYNTGSRFLIAFSAIVANLLAGLLVILLSMSYVVMAVGMIMLIMLAPVFLLIGVHPGFGRGVALKWLEMLIGTAVKRIILATMLAIVIAFYQIILGIPGMPWFSQILLILAVGVGALVYRKPIMEAFNVVNLGGSRTGMERGMDQEMKKAGAAGAGTVGGALGGVTGGGGIKGAIVGAAHGGMRGSRSGSVMRAASIGMKSGAAGGRRVQADRQREFQEEVDQASETLQGDPENREALAILDKAHKYNAKPDKNRNVRVGFDPRKNEHLISRIKRLEKQRKAAETAGLDQHAQELQEEINRLQTYSRRRNSGPFPAPVPGVGGGSVPRPGADHPTYEDTDGNPAPMPIHVPTPPPSPNGAGGLPTQPPPHGGTRRPGE